MSVKNDNGSLHNFSAKRIRDGGTLIIHSGIGAIVLPLSHKVHHDDK